jgi:hypothetical protein
VQNRSCLLFLSYPVFVPSFEPRSRRQHLALGVSRLTPAAKCCHRSAVNERMSIGTKTSSLENIMFHENA